MGKRNNFPLFRYLSAFHNKFIIGATHILGAITRNIKTNCRHGMFCGPPFTIILQDSKYTPNIYIYIKFRMCQTK